MPTDGTRKDALFLLGEVLSLRNAAIGRDGDDGSADERASERYVRIDARGTTEERVGFERGLPERERAAAPRAADYSIVRAAADARDAFPIAP